MTKFNTILIQWFYIEAGGRARITRIPYPFDSKDQNMKKWFNLMTKFNTILIQWFYVEAGDKCYTDSGSLEFRTH